MLTVLLLFGTANAKTMTFDEISFPNSQYGYGQIYSYQGFDFQNAGVCQADRYPIPSGYHTGVISPHNTLFNWARLDLTISNTSTFNLNSSYFTAAWNDGMSVRITGRLNGSTLYQTSFLTDTQIPVFIDFDWIGINSIFVESYGIQNKYNYVAIDNIDYDMTTAPVPEPATIFLMGIGLLGIIGYQRKVKMGVKI